MRVCISTQMSPHFLKFCPLVRYLQCHLVCILLITVKMEHLKKKKMEHLFIFVQFQFPFFACQFKSSCLFFFFLYSGYRGFFFPLCGLCVASISSYCSFFPKLMAIFDNRLMILKYSSLFIFSS